MVGIELNKHMITEENWDQVHTCPGLIAREEVGYFENREELPVDAPQLRVLSPKSVGNVRY